MKKILFILDNLEGGGAERVFVNIANAFVAKNISVEFLLGIKKGVYLSILNPCIPVKEVGGTTLVKYLNTFSAIFKQNNYTHIFTASHYASSAAIITKKINRLPVKIYLTHHYSYPPKRPLKYLKGDMVLKLIHFFITPYANKIIAVSRGTLQWLRKFSHHKLPQGVFIYNPVFDEKIYALAKEEVKFPTDIQNKIILLNVGRLAEVKDHLTLIKAFRIFKETHGNALLFIVGTGPLQLTLEAYIKECGLLSFVFLIGFEANPYKWMSKCDVLVMSSVSEGFGNVLVEAMALGKTVVSTNCPSGPAEILQQGNLGYLCPVGDPVEMANSIGKAIQHPIDSDILIQSTQQYRVSEIVKKYIDIL